MKAFGEFTPMDSVVSQDNLLDLHVAVSSAEELSHYPNNTIAVFTKDDCEFHSGDVVINRGDGRGWVTLKSSFATLGPVMDLRGYRMNKRVYLKWKDPEDEFTVDGKVKCRWHHDIVVRKYGSDPKDELDGTVVRKIYEKSRYGEAGYKYLIDYAPDSDKDAEWHYRVFSVADNGAIDYSRTAPAITLIDLKWSEIIDLIKAGKASEMFAVGDSWRLDDGNEMMIANISKYSPYRVTFILRYSRYNIPFDVDKCIKYGGNNFFLTKDERLSSSKVYYTQEPDGSFKAGTYYGGPIGDLDGKLYERVASGTGREVNGTNRWMASDLRMWMNLKYANDNVTIRPGVNKYIEKISGMSVEDYKANLLKSPAEIDDSVPIPPYFYLKKYLPDVLEAITFTQCETKMPACDGLNMDSTSDTFFVPSITEATGKSNSGYMEGSQFDLFKDLVVDNKTLQDLSFNGIAMFTRSAYLKNKTRGYQLNPMDGSDDLLTANENFGVIVAFNVG